MCACVHTLWNDQDWVFSNAAPQTFVISHKTFFFRFFNYMWVCGSGYMPPTAGSLGNQKNVSDLLELKLQAVMSCPMCGCWEPNAGLLQEQCLLSTTVSLQPRLLNSQWQERLKSTLLGILKFGLQYCRHSRRQQSLLWTMTLYALVIVSPSSPDPVLRIFRYLCSTPVKSAFKDHCDL